MIKNLAKQIRNYLKALSILAYSDTSASSQTKKNNENAAVKGDISFKSPVGSSNNTRKNWSKSVSANEII